MLKKLFMLSILSAAILSHCSDGCLRCDLENDRCQFCDIQRGFKTVRGECMKVYSDNCAIFNFEGFCIHCEKGYFLDTFAMRCVPVPEIGLVKNCESYSADNTCYKCLNGFYLLHNNTCVEITTAIDNCKVYRSPELCYKCQVGYQLTLDFKTCEKPTEISNCVSFSKVQCQQCKNGYKKNPNNYLMILFGFKNSRGMRQLENKLISETQEDLLPAYNTCQKLDIDNCLVYASPNECAKCSPNHYLQQNECIAYPKERILNCLKYKSLTECIECDEGMHLKTEQECQLNDKVDDCISYDASATETTCLQCAATHFLSEFNVCSERTSVSDIANCVQISKTSETCKECIENFTLTTDKKKCLQRVVNCDQHEESDVSTMQLACRVCEEGFYYDQESQSCKEGTISKCVRYSRVSNSCEECENRYYLAGGLCRTHEDLVYCDTYNKLKKNSCSVCNDKTVLLFRLNTCLPVSYIQNCNVYETQTKCQLCDDGYELNNEKKCQQIPGSEFCLQKNDNECVKCLESYVLENGSCHLPLAHVTRNCASYNVNGLLSYTQLTCNYCNENTIPMNYKFSFTCYEKKYLENQLEIDTNDKCLKYKEVEGQYECVGCVKEYLLLDGQCIEGPYCPNQNTLRLQVIQQLDVDSDGNFDSFYVEKVNECGPKINNCKVAAPDLLQDQTNVRYSCVTCDDDMISIVEFSDKKVLMRPPRFEGDQTFSPLNHASAKVCKDPSNEQILGKVDNDNCIQNCELYQTLTGFGLGCQKCKHGMTGRVYDLIHQCLKYSSLTSCTQCAEGFYPVHPYQCERVQPVQYCIRYDGSDSQTKGKCKECDKDFYVDTNTNKCVQRDNFVDHCDKYNPDNQNCKECKMGHFLLNNECHKKIYKCKEYDNSTTCKLCEDGHYLMNNLCYKGSDNNCVVYEQGPGKINKCKVCKNKFYLKENLCIEFATDIYNCDQYSQENTFCNKCEPGYLLFQMNKQCNAVKQVANCKEYGSRESCRVCNDGYYPVNYGLRCLAIPSDKNCAKWGPLTQGVNYDEDNCLKCLSGSYFLLINKKCRPWFKVIKENCQQPVEVIDGTQSFYKCKYCNTNMKPMNVDKEGLCLEDDILDSFPDVPSIPNCVRYTMKTGELKCLQCATDFYVKNQTQCVTLDQCKSTTGYYPTKLVVDTTGDDNTNIKQGASCINDANKFADVSNCIYQPVISGTFFGGTGQYKYGCVQCMTGYLPFIDITNTTKRLAYSLSDTNINSTIPVYDGCLKPADITLQGTPNSNNEIENCDIYSKYSADTNYFCLTCKPKYRGEVKPGQKPTDVTSVTFLNSIIDKCSSFTSCSSNIVTAQSMIPSAQQYLHASYLNVFDMGILFSGCNKCNDATKALVAFVNVNTADTQNAYQKVTGLGAIKTVGTSPAKGDTVADSDGYSYDCLTINGDGNMVLGDKLYPTVENCQKYIINANTLAVNAASHAAPSTVDYACVQCKPGYRPTRALDGAANNTGQEIITTCVQIGNCKDVNSTTQPGSCDLCADNYAFKYDTNTNEVLLDSCILTDKANCYSASDSACILCNQGYILDNNTGDCVLQKPPMCEVYNPHTDTHLTKKFTRYSFKLMQNASGCVKCQSGYIPMQYANNYLQAIQLEEVKKVCVNSSNVEAITGPIQNCTTANLRQNLRSEYESNVELRVDCIDCDSTYIETQDGKCISASNNPNCNLVESSTNNYCVKCADNYLSIAGVCKTNSSLDANCDQFADMSFRTGALCKKCKNGYYLVTEVIDSVVSTSCQQYSGTEIQNCAQFDSTDLSRLFCVECVANFALMILSGDEVNGKAGYNRLCLDVTNKVQAQCAEFSISAQSNGQFVCQKCNDEFMLEDIQGNQNVCVNTLTTVANCAEVDINDQLEQQYQGVTFKNNYFPRLSTLKCKKCTPDYFLQTNTNSCASRTRTNAQTYSNQCNQFEDLDDYCKVCKENYFLSGDKTQCIPAPIVTHSQGSLFSCTEFNQCKKDVYRSGLDSHIDSLLSCHECKKSSEIPFIAISGEMPYKTITGLNQYNIKTGENQFTNLIGGKSNFCAQPVPATFNIDNSNNDKFAFPTNCAVGVLNVDTNGTLDAFHANKTTGVELTKVQVFCAACKPGFKFKPSLDTSNKQVPYMAGECEAINKCKYSTAFNNCTECEKGYAFDYTNGEVQYDTCVAVTDNEDCYAKDTTNNKCQFCCKGTYLNKDGLCERIQPPKCEYNQYVNKQVYKFKDLNTGLYLSSQGTGCNKCEDGFYALYKPQNHWVCTESEAHYANLLPQQTEYITNCVNYFQENEALKCKKCKDGFVPIKQEGLCTAVSSGLQNCLFALSDVHCEICEEDYVLVNRACQKKNIDKCYQYTYNIESHQQVCIDCEAGYYLEANTCLPGNVKNCLLYETNTVCNKCNPGFHLVKRNDGVSYCYPIDQRLNCARFDSNEFQKGRLQCTQCATNQFVISTDYDQYYSTHCLKFFETPNCVKYDIKPAIADSSFSCLECTSNFYLADQECQVRTVEPQHCIAFNKTEDICSECEDGFFVNEDGTSCHPYPVGTPDCRIYTDAMTCISCNNNYYLSNGLCVLVGEDFRVENCLYYVGPNLCDQCQEGYLNVDGQCQKIQAQNCAEVESLLACASCPQGFGFVEENSIKSCVQQSIQNCVDFDPNPDYKCLQCEVKFYADAEGVCVAVETEIPHCLVYAEEGICSRCESFTALSQDKSKCLINRLVVDQIDQNCQESQVLENYQCRACQDGYVFVEEKCQRCELEENENCQVCDPLYLNQCLMCKTGFFMNVDGVCEKYVPPVIDVDDYLNPPVDPTPETPTDSENSTLNLACYLTMMIIVNFFF